MNLQTTCATAGLQSVLDKVEQRADQCVAVAKKLAALRIVLPAHGGIPSFGSAAAQERTAARPGSRGRSAADRPGEHQHVANLVLQLVQARFQTAGETLLLLLAQATLLKVACIQQRGGKRCANLMG